MEFLARNEAPLTPEQWIELDMIVVDTIKRYLVGRRFIPLYGPVGSGMPAVTVSKLKVLPDEPVTQDGTYLVEFKEISQDFIVPWKTFEMSSRLQVPVDWSLAAAASYQFSQKEDKEIFTKLLTAEGKLDMKGNDWKEPGTVLSDVTKALSQLVEAGHIGPYTLILPPAVHPMLYRFIGNGGMLEIKIIEELMKSGVFVSNLLKPKEMVIVETGSMNMDLALGMDVITAYLGPDNMEHMFRIMQTMALRIKRPSAICLVASADK